MRRISITNAVLFAAMLCVMSATASWAAEAKVATAKSKNDILSKVVPIDNKFSAMIYRELIGPWLQWYVNLHVEPWNVEDPAIWAENQPCMVWFLAGIGTYEKPVRRCVKIPRDTAIFFPVINTSYIGWPQRPYNEKSFMGWRTVIPRMDAVLELQCIIDGVSIPNLFQYRVNSGGKPKWSGELYQAPEGWQASYLPPDLHPGMYPYVSDGYWLLLQPLTAGKHTIQIRGKCGSTIDYFGPFEGFTIDVTYDVIVGK